MSSSNDDLLDSLRKAVELSPDDVNLRLHLARMLLLSGDAAAAREHALRVLEVDADHAEAKEIVDDAGATNEPSEPPVASGHGEPSANARALDPSAVITLSDVAGLETVKRRLHTEFLLPAQNPELAAKYGKSPKGGLLLFGPPGCGKTFLARALAGELGASFVPVDSATIVSSYPGASASRIKQLFAEARRRTPSLLFFDEVDAVAPRRSSLRNAAWLKGMVNQLLSELDGFEDNRGLFVVGATNAPWDVDTAMRRPGRFDRTVAVLPPDLDARVGILRTHIEGRPTGQVDFDRLAEETDGYSGADLVHAIDEAASEAFEQAMDIGDEVTIDTAMLRRAIGGIRPSIRSWMEDAKNHVMFANQDGSLDDLATWMRDHRML